MPDNIFNTHLFKSSTEPLPNQVFKKAFDAYFFLEYPPFQYNPTEVYYPFHFMNNLNEKTVHIQSSEGTSKIEYTINTTTWDAEPYYANFKDILNAERFLFWQGENDKWAMVSDDKNKIAIMGIDWDVSDQVPLFHEQCLLSPAQVLERLDLAQHEAIFMRNYAPKSILTSGDKLNPMWVKYYCQCHVETENEKLFYWAQFEKLYHAFSKLLVDFKGLDMYASQSFVRRYKQRGTIYSTGKFAPVGGWQNYTYENCKKVATKFLTQNQHLQLKFEGKMTESEALYRAAKNGLIEFMNFWLYANLQKTKIKGHANDFYFLMDAHYLSDISQKYNQGFEFSYRKDLLTDAAVEGFISTLIDIGFVKKIHRLVQPQKCAKYTLDAPLKIEGIYGTLPDLEGGKDSAPDPRGEKRPNSSLG